VRHASRFEDEIPGAGDADLVPDLDADLALEHVGVLVLVAVRVHRRGEDARLDRMLDEREVSSGLRSIDHEPHAQPAHQRHLALIRRKHDARAWAPSSGHDRPPRWLRQSFSLDTQVVY
jgi:hypothetical protein